MPASPSPDRRIRVPSSTPAGTLTERVRSRVNRPEPPQRSQGLSIVWPRPWHVGQVRSIAKNPCCALTRPWPAQVLQVVGFEPAFAPAPPHISQVSEVGNLIDAVLPRNASSRVISRL